MDYMRVANCRGKKPVLNDIKNCILKLQTVQTELNACKAKIHIQNAVFDLFDVLEKEGYEISTTGRLIKKS